MERRKAQGRGAGARRTGRDISGHNPAGRRGTSSNPFDGQFDGKYSTIVCAQQICSSWHGKKWTIVCACKPPFWPESLNLAPQEHKLKPFRGNSRESRMDSPRIKLSSANNHRFFATTSDQNHLRLLPGRHRSGTAPTAAAKSGQLPWSKSANCRGKIWPTAVVETITSSFNLSMLGES